MYILVIILAVVIGLYFVLDKRIHVQKELVVNKKVEEVWEVMGNQFARVHLWSTNFKDSKPGGSSKFPGLDYSARITVTDRGETIQELDAFDTAEHSLAYHISKGAPGIAKQASAIWSLNSDEADKTIVVLEFNMETKGFLGFLMTPMIKMGMGKSAAEIAGDLKYYVENGTPHPRKVKIQ
tara:strand:- start:996 stop:1538 length:543 start_codon:yes stop_codon:yes gene_type:complete